MTGPLLTGRHGEMHGGEVKRPVVREARGTSQTKPGIRWIAANISTTAPLSLPGSLSSQHQHHRPSFSTWLPEQPTSAPPPLFLYLAP
ncbi:hypothetical protein ACOMHN_053603 [Nucella lapillus]